MPWIPEPLMAEICQIFTDADHRTRNDFSINEVVNERDYLSRFLTLAAYPRVSGGNKYKGIYNISCSGDSVERKHGIDALFAFKYNGEIKLAVCECKIEKPNFDNGRFARQLNKQRRLLRANPEIVAFEMFFHRQHRPPYDPHLSSICLLDQIDNYIRIARGGRPITHWVLADLDSLFTHLVPWPGFLNIGSLIWHLLECRIGIRIPESNYGARAASAAFNNREDGFMQATRNLINNITGRDYNYTQVVEYCRTFDFDAICCIDLNQVSSDRSL